MEDLLNAPAFQRKKLGRRLAQTRKASGLVQKRVAEEMHWSQSKVARIESGEVGVSHAELVALLKVYGIENERLVLEMTQIAEIARRSSLPQISEVHSKEFREYLENEREAHTLQSFEPTFIPGLLQTPQYRAAVLRNDFRYPSLDKYERKAVDRKIEQKVTVMEWRQQILVDQGSLARASFVVDEAVIRRTVGAEVGDVTVMEKQLEHLKSVLSNPKVDFRVIRFKDGAHQGMGKSPYVLLDFATKGDPLLYEETATGELTTREDEKRITLAESSFEALQDAACRGAQLESLLDDALASL